VLRCASRLGDAVVVSTWVDVDVRDGMFICALASIAFTLAITTHITNVARTIIRPAICDCSICGSVMYLCLSHCGQLYGTGREDG
jgi:hypothetical protein